MMLSVSLALLGCRPSDDTLTLHVPPEHEAVFREFAEFTGYEGIEVTADDGRGRGQDVLLELVPGKDPGWYSVVVDNRVTIRGGSVLGLQYGLAALLEEQGFRFVHPQHTIVPETLGDLRETSLSGLEVTPESELNGLHLHTLHPIEALYDLWEPGEDSARRARQILDWMVKNRGNHLQWPGLDNIMLSPVLAEPWQEHTRAIADAAHARGMTVGIGVQLFGSGNLQLAFDLVDGSVYSESEVDERLALLAPVGLDSIHLSFGEFSGEEPERFVQTGNQALERIQAAMPGVQTTTTIHVGNYEDLRIEYQGQEMLYYFLGTYMDAVPHIHTVMYYNLFDDAGGAYLHDEFDEHREYLLNALKEGRRVGYHPESAYWIAFDNSIPQYLPVYIRSRHVDLSRIRSEGGYLPEHTLFSSGWEWGYWQTDLLTMRMVHQTPADWGDEVRWLWAPWGEAGSAVAEAVIALGERQHQGHLVERLAAYMAGRDAIIDLGDSLGILSQPDRPQFGELASLEPAQLAELDAVVDSLQRLSDDTAAILGDIADVSTGDPALDVWIDEVRDGMEIDRLRAAFSAASYRTALASARGQDASAGLSEMEALISEARTVVARRHGALRWGGGERLIAQSDENDSIYQFGYLAKADSLCFWDRERIQVTNLVQGTSEPVPPCT